MQALGCGAMLDESEDILQEHVWRDVDSSFGRAPGRRWLVEIKSQPSTDSARVGRVLGVEPPLQVALLWHDDELLHHKHGRSE
jgi:hypothetical protein